MPRFAFGLVPGAFLAASLLATPERSSGAEPPDGGPVKIVIQILTDLNIASLTIDVETFGPWAKPILEKIERRFRHEPGRRDVVLQVTLHREGPPEVAAGGRPALSDDELKALVEAADAPAAPHARLADFAFRLVAKINGGHPDDSSPLVPRLETPEEARLARFRAASTPDRLAILRRWALEEAIPILAGFASRADPKYEGVRNFGKALGALDASGPIDVAALTERNPEFWRATVEMVPGQPLVPAARIALHLARGEVDRARRLAELAASFDARNSGPSHLLGVLGTFLPVFYKDVEARITAGVALHDRGRFPEAIAVYESVLNDYPASAWATYEVFHSRRTIAMNEGRPPEDWMAGWPKTRADLLARDPLYPTMAQARTGVEAYQVMRRREIEELFKPGRDARKDLIRYADIALDLEEWGFAAPIYWNALTSLKPEDYDHRPILENFLFCLERLGITQLKGNFRGDHAAAFAEIAAERRKIMESDPLFRAMDKKGGPEAEPGREGEAKTP